MTDPFFSVVTITYDNLPGLRRTVASVDEQDFTNVEHIVIDGGSTDGSAQWLASQEPHEHRSWSSEPDGGIYDAMNKGIARGRGRLVVMMNSGDTFSDARTLSTVYQSWTRESWEWAYGAVRFTTDDGTVCGSTTFDPFRRGRFLLGLEWIPHATVYMNRAFLESLGPYRLDLGTAADQELLMRAVKRANPHVISWFLADFCAGGISTHVTPRQRELSWHALRAASGTLVGGNRVSDRLVSEMLGLRKWARGKVGRMIG